MFSLKRAWLGWQGGCAGAAWRGPIWRPTSGCCQPVVIDHVRHQQR